MLFPDDSDFELYQNFAGSDIDVIDADEGHRKISYTVPDTIGGRKKMSTNAKFVDLSNYYNHPFEIITMDFMSDGKKSAPFLMAVTVE